MLRLTCSAAKGAADGLSIVSYRSSSKTHHPIMSLSRSWLGAGRSDPAAFPRLDELPYLITWPLTLLMARFKVSPNWVGLASFLAGLAFIGLLLDGESAALSGTATAMLLLRVMLDCVDGQLARLTARTSQLGAQYDLAADFVFALLLFPSLAFHLYWGERFSAPLAGLLALASLPAFLLNATTASLLAKLSQVPADPESARLRFAAPSPNDRPDDADYSRRLERLNRFFVWTWRPVTLMVYNGLTDGRSIHRPRLIAHLLSPCEYGFQLLVLVGCGGLGVSLSVFLWYPLVCLLLMILILTIARSGRFGRSRQRF
jgi:hypothetical protein